MSKITVEYTDGTIGQYASVEEAERGIVENVCAADDIAVKRVLDAEGNEMTATWVAKITQKPPETRHPRFWPRPVISSNDVITARNGGVRHLFINDIGGCADNYR